MKKRRTLALLMAGILTASALAISASAADAGTDMVPEAGIAQEETIREKKYKTNKHMFLKKERGADTLVSE